MARQGELKVPVPKPRPFLNRESQVGTIIGFAGRERNWPPIRALNHLNRRSFQPGLQEAAIPVGFLDFKDSFSDETDSGRIPKELLQNLVANLVISLRINPDLRHSRPFHDTENERRDPGFHFRQQITPILIKEFEKMSRPL